MTTRAWVGTILIFSLFLIHCGGSQPDVETQPVVVEPVVEVEPPSLETPEEDIDTVYYVVYWNGLHVLSIYQGGGPIRSEYPDDPSCGFGGRSEFMSILSHYCEHEADVLPFLDEAETLEDFLRLLEENEHEIIEYEFEEGY